MVRAKFVVDSILQHRGGTNVTLVPVFNGSEENKMFWKYTPSGKVDINMNEGVEAADYFEVGQEYYIDFTLASK